jgi:tetratricopeptide (TPR) repeat protein
MNELDFTEITRLNEKYSKEPKSRIFVQLADLYRKNNMIDEALDVLNKGFEFHPQYPVAYLILGKCYYDKRSHTQARDAFEKTIALDPQNIVALRMLAKTCEILKDERGQINTYKSIIAIDPLDTNAKEKLSMLEALQRKEPMYTVAMAEEYEKQGNHEEALKIYEHLLYTDPSDLILNQKVTELKKILNEEKRKLEEEKIEDMQVEPVFKTDELVQKEKPEKLQIESFDRGREPVQTASGDNEIQSLEDFLVEELEQAAEKKAGQNHEEESAPLIEDDRNEEIIPKTQPIEEATMPGPSPEVAEPPLDLTQETPPETAETVLPEEEKEPPVPFEEPTQPEPMPIPAEEPVPSIEATTPSPAIDTNTQAEEPIPHLETTTPEEQIPPVEPIAHPEEHVEPVETVTRTEETTALEPTPPVRETTGPEEVAATGKADDAEKKEEPRKPKEEDFKSFQDWLSGLLK